MDFVTWSISYILGIYRHHGTLICFLGNMTCPNLSDVKTSRAADDAAGGDNGGVGGGGVDVHYCTLTRSLCQRKFVRLGLIGIGE